MITETDLKHLKRCVELARTALELGDEPFGSVLVSDQAKFSLKIAIILPQATTPAPRVRHRAPTQGDACGKAASLSTLQGALPHVCSRPRLGRL